jgi:hypothetical protein
MAAEFNGSLAIEFIDTFMYGFWGEGHTWPFANTPFPDYQTAERTWGQHARGSTRALHQDSVADEHAAGL